ncbi:hypothetical protein MKW92_027425 [Papaver armeniacum]|nr:hypothetical protein MKW92_027425 [Papaver armeniacum]
MEMASSSTMLPRSQSDQLETMLRKSPSAESASLARKLRIGSSPGPRKHSRSGQIDEGSSGGALSRASSASFGFFSSAGFTVPPEDIANLQEVSDDDIPEDIEANTRKKIHTEPTLPIYLKFTDVKYKVVLRGVRTIMEKNILNGITGSASPGEVLALMGPSGSGKTTLLNLLSGRLIESASGGSITYNDQQYSKSLKRRHNDRRFLCAGISGGERKRVCIGNEILLNPSLLFLDEPTSGLDSTTALRMVRMLHEIAKAGKTVVTTIHQPSSRLFHKFDKLILLGKGSLLYFGNASEAMVYFSSIGCTPLIAMNPAEFLVDLANGNINDVSVPLELKDKVQMDDSTRETNTGKPSPTVIHEFLVEAYETRVAEKENKNLWRQSPLTKRQHDYLSWLRITQVLSTAIVLGMLWWRSDSSTPRGLQDQAGLLFFIAVFWGYFPVFTAIFTFPQERAMLNKERAVDMYRLSAYFAARTTSDLPLDLFLPVLFLLIVYFMAGLRLSVAPFVLSMLIVFLSIIAAQGLGLAIGAMLMDVKKATTLASITAMTFMLAGGFFVKRVPVFISWIRYISFNYHTYRLLLKVQYDHIPPALTGIQQDRGFMEITAMLAMVVGYRLLAYISLRNMKLA